MATSEQRRKRRRRCLPGFPRDVVFQTPEEMRNYLNARPDAIQCLECGRWLRTIGQHLRAIHEMTVDEYQRAHGIYYGRKLACEETRDLFSHLALVKLADEVLKPDLEANRRRMQKAVKQGRQRFDLPAHRVQSGRNLGDPHVRAVVQGECSALGKLNRNGVPPAPFGSDEHKRRLRARWHKRSEEFKMQFAHYWKGRKQSPEHIMARFANRTTKTERPHD